MKHLTLLAFVGLLVGCASNDPPPASAATADQPIVSVNGEVLRVDGAATGEHGEKSAQKNLRATISTGSGPTRNPIKVELAPRWYLNEYGLALSPKDIVVVQGVRDGNGVLQAHQLRRGNTQLNLRDDNGEPLWDAPKGR